MEDKRLKKAILVVIGVVLTIIGFFAIPPLLKKYSAKMYKSSLDREEIDFDNLGPEIVTDKKTKEDEGRNC